MNDKYKKLDYIMEFLEDSFIEEALEGEYKKIHRFPLQRYIIVAACVCFLIAGTGCFFRSYIYNVSNNKKENIPVIKYEKDLKNKESLGKIVCGLQSEGAGGGEFGWLLIKSLSDVASKNPTRNNIGGITELPVFKNEDGLWSEETTENGINESEIYFPYPLYEEKMDYCFDGTSQCRWCICFSSDKRKSLTDQLLEYTFYRIKFTAWGKEKYNEIKKYSVMKPPSGTGKMYPVISLSEAEEKLRKGEFLSHSPYDKDVASTAQILSVELEYLTQEYQVYLQPFYKFIITDDSWDISDVMTCENWKEYTSVSEVYVPAVQDKYLDIRENALLRTN